MEESKPTNLISRLKTLIPPALTFLAIMGPTVALRYASQALVREDMRKSSYDESGRVADLLEQAIDLRIRSVAEVANHLVNSASISEQYFAGFAQESRRQTPGILSYSVTDTDLNPLMIEAEAEFEMETLKAILGTEGVSIFLEEARLKAIETGKLVLTDALRFGRYGQGFAAVAPIIREDDLAGFVLAIISHQAVIDSLGLGTYDDFRTLITHGLTPMNMESYIQSAAGIQPTDPQVLEKPAQTSVIVGTQIWMVSVEPTGTPTSFRGSMPVFIAPGSILLLGTVIAILLSLLLYREQYVAARSRHEARHSRTKLDTTRDRLARIKEELDLILNNVDEGIILYDEDLIPLQANTSFKRTFDARLSLDFMKAGAELHHGEMARLFQNEAQYWSLLNNIRNNPERAFTDEIETKPRDEDEPRRYYQRRATTVCGPDGSRRGYLVLYRDISESRTVERLKEDFLSSVTHDLRTPLASIKGFAETMLRDSAMPLSTREEFTHIISNESTRLQSMIDDLLDLRRLEAGKNELSPAQFNLRKLVEDEIASSQPILFDPRDIEVEITWNGDADKTIAGDVGMIGRAVRNILSNAAKYAPPNSKIYVHGWSKEDLVELRILDEGPGIPAEDMPHIFEKFYRGSRHVRRTQGTGLGLAIVRHIVESHGGTATAENGPNGGTMITMILPRVVDLGLAASQPEGKPDAGSPIDAMTASS